MIVFRTVRGCIISKFFETPYRNSPSPGNRWNKVGKNVRQIHTLLINNNDRSPTFSHLLKKEGKLENLRYLYTFETIRKCKRGLPIEGEKYGRLRRNATRRKLKPVAKDPKRTAWKN